MKAYNTNVLLKIVTENSDYIEGEIISIGNNVSTDLTVGMKVVIGKYAGQLYKAHIIVNYTDTLVIL